MSSNYSSYSSYRGSGSSSRRGRGSNFSNRGRGNIVISQMGKQKLIASDLSHDKDQLKDFMDNIPKDHPLAKEYLNYIKEKEAESSSAAASANSYANISKEDSSNSQFHETAFKEVILLIEEKDLQWKSNPDYILERYLNKTSFVHGALKQRQYFEGLLLSTKSVEITHHTANSKDEVQGNFSFSKLVVKKIISFEEWGFSPLAEKEWFGGGRDCATAIVPLAQSPGTIAWVVPRVVEWRDSAIGTIARHYRRRGLRGVTSWYQSSSLSELGVELSIPRLRLAKLIRSLSTWFVMVNTRSRVGATDEANEASVTAPEINRPMNTPINQVIPPIPPMLEGIIDANPQVNLETEDPVVQEADPQSVLLASIMQMMNSAMDKRDEKLLKILEDRDTSNRRHETVEDNAVLGSGGADNAVGTEEHAVRADRGKERGCSFKTFLCSRAPEFLGTTDPLACIKWIQDVEMAFESSECADAQRVKFASQLLRGDALSWWNITRRALTPEILAKLPWPTFKKKIMEKYCNERALDKIEEEFKNLKKGNLSVADYAKQLLDKLSIVEHLATDEKSQIKAFVRGLPTDMKTGVRNAHKATLQEVIEESQLVEDDLIQEREEQKVQGEKRKWEGPTGPARPSKPFNGGRNTDQRREARWCPKCRIGIAPRGEFVMSVGSRGTSNAIALS
ncbi:hypothetical protein L6452_06072 [Arctium lappa]|uniref:Uncharacterized protein n=1 Tax=Arctium lappa TaxID=4217 RepID=A0ACB9EI65_ARCLA|nr:hypothetical protein L6452_06072 [Arctium lappa]